MEDYEGDGGWLKIADIGKRRNEHTAWKKVLSLADMIHRPYLWLRRRHVGPFRYVQQLPSNERRWMRMK